MTLKQLWIGTSNWLRIPRLGGMFDPQPDVDDDGLLSQGTEPNYENGDEDGVDGKYIVKAKSQADKRDAMEKLQDGFNTLVEQLHGINEHLDRQVTQHQELMTRIEKLPQWMQALPEALDGQKEATQQMFQQLKASAAKQEQFADTVAQIPLETAKQTDALLNINHQLAAAADTDVQMADNFNNISGTLDKINHSALNQTEGIVEMNRAFATSDRYLKYVVTKQNKRFLWVFIGSMSLCVTVILALAGVIVYLNL